MYSVILEKCLFTYMHAYGLYVFINISAYILFLETDTNEEDGVKDQ